ncbi:MAG TPA: VOC family protein [Candidatus Binataceae bacterium]|nr:VOC family protein [Candidatus Binataceae bacterium]
MIKRFDRLDVATSDLAAASLAYEQNFGFSVLAGDGGESATIAIGDAQIRLQTGASVAELLASSGEGLAAIWLEADDVAIVADALRRAAVEFAPIRQEGDRRVLAINPAAANMVPLFIFDRKS